MFRRSRKRDSFEQVVAFYGGPLLRFVARLTGDPSGAEDLVQDVFIRLAANWKGAMEPGPQMTNWLRATAHNLAVDAVRAAARRAEAHRRDALERGTSSPPAATGAGPVSDGAAAVADALAALSDREREMVVLRVYEEKSYREIAERMGLTVGNVGYILHNAMAKLAARLAEFRRGGDER